MSALALALRSAVLDVLDEAGIRVPVTRRGMLRNAILSKITGVLERELPTGVIHPLVSALLDATEKDESPGADGFSARDCDIAVRKWREAGFPRLHSGAPGDEQQALARVHHEPALPARALSPWGTDTETSTRPGDADPVITPAQRAAFEKGELVLLPVTVPKPGRLGETEQALVPVAPRDLRAGIESARRSVEDVRGRIAARLGDMPPAPERCMLRAHLDSGYLDVWIEDVERWRRAMLEEFVAPTGRRA